jgi:uridylate kinase
MKADLIIKATNVDGVYDKNPQTHENPKKYKSLTYKELKKIIKNSTKQLPGEYGLFDMKGVRLAEKLGIPIIFIDGRDPWELVKAVKGTHDGTTVHL